MNITEVIANKSAKAGIIKIIGIDGHGGSGKSTLAKILAKNLNATLIHTDDFASHEVPFDWQQKITDAVFTPIISGAKTLNYMPSKWWPDHHPDPIIDQPVNPIIIIEGVSTLRKSFRKYLTLSIYVDTPPETCLARGLERDKNNGENLEIIKQQWIDWIAAETEYMLRDNPRAHADIVIDGTKPFGDQLDF